MLRMPLFSLSALSLTLLLACAGPRPQAAPSAAPSQVVATRAEEPSAERYERIVVVGTNDFHGYLRTVETTLGNETLKAGGAEWFGGYARILREKYGDRLVLLDGGDLFQGTIESNTFLGEPVIEFYNLLPYRAVVVGNHEFDYGPRRRGDPDRLGALKDRMAQANFPFVQANTFWKKRGDLWREKNLYPSVMIAAGGVKVGVIGLTTESTAHKTLPLNVAGLEFRNFLKPTIAEAQALRRRGATVVLIAAHEGGEKPGTPMYDLLAALPKGLVDGVVAGHFHQQVNEFVAGVPVIQSRTRGLYFGRFDLYVDKQTGRVDPALTRIHTMHAICGNWLRREDSCDGKVARDAIASGRPTGDFLPLRPATYEGVEVRPHLEVRAAIAPYLAKAEGRRAEVLGRARRDFAELPTRETEMGTLFTDAFRAQFPQARVIYLNGGGIRRKLLQGEITYGDLFEMHPFDNFALRVRITGKQLRDLVRVGVSGAQSLPVVSGIKIAYHADDKPEYERDLNGDGKKEQWERDRLLAEGGLVWEGTGAEVRDEEIFWVATNDYLVTGGDNTSRVFTAVSERDRVFLDLTQREVVAEYLRKNPGLPLPREEAPKLRALR